MSSQDETMNNKMSILITSLQKDSTAYSRNFRSFVLKVFYCFRRRSFVDDAMAGLDIGNQMVLGDDYSRPISCTNPSNMNNMPLIVGILGGKNKQTDNICFFGLQNTEDILNHQNVTQKKKRFGVWGSGIIG